MPQSDSEPIRKRRKRTSSIGVLLPAEICAWYKAYCAEREESMSKYTLALVQYFKARTESQSEADREICRQVHSLVRNIKRKPRGNGKKQ